MIDRSALAEIKTIDSDVAKLSPAVLVEQARSPNSALHNYFTWDDTEAAHNFRLLEAGRVIKAAVRMLPAPKTEPTRVVAAPTPIPRPLVERYTAPVKMSESWARNALKTELNTALQIYGDFPALMKILLAAKTAISGLDSKPSPEVSFERAAKVIEQKLTSNERQIFLYLPADGSWRNTSGAGMSLLVKIMWRNYPADDLISMVGSGRDEQACLKPMGKLVRGIIAAGSGD